MKLKSFLLWAPFILAALLLQAFWWVPGYDDPGSLRPAQAQGFVEASSGDAKLLNPILNADSSSARVVELVFDGLLDLDENLELRGRLAESWHIDHTAFLVIRPGVPLADGAVVDAPTLRDRVRTYLEEHPLLGALVHEVELDAPTPLQRDVPAEAGDAGRGEGRFRIQPPARLRIRLDRVVQDLYQHLQPLLGESYAQDYDPRQIAVFDRQPRADARAHHADTADGPRLEQALGMLPLIEHRPRIRFRLRRGVTFHDGHPFDADDVVFTYRAIMEPRNLSPRRADFEPIDAVRIIDTHTVDVVYKRLFSPAINAWIIGILPAHRLNDAAREADMARQKVAGGARETFGMRQYQFNRAPVGTGAFSFVEWKSGEHVRLRRNPDYWDGPPNYRDYHFRILPDPLTREIEFRSGSVDTYLPQPHQAARYADDPRYQAFSNPTLGYTYIGYNLRREPFNDARVRQALGMAIDVDPLIRFVLYGEGERTTGPYPAATPWYDHSVRPLPHDPAKAKALLAEVGWLSNADGWLERDGKLLEFTLITNNGNPVRKSVLAIAQDAWRAIGVKAHTQVFEWAVFLEDFINPGDFDAVVLGWRTGIDADQYQIWHSSQTGPNQLNFVGYKSPETDELIERLRREYDPAQQRQLAHAVHRRIAADQPYTFLFTPRVTRVLDRRIAMRESDGTVVPVRVSRGGDVFFHMNRWVEVEHAP